MNSFTGLLNNAVLLLALGVIYDILGLYKLRHKPLRNLLTGLLIGLVAMLVMLTPWELVPGIFFDSRWVLLSLCGLFFGPVPTLIAVVMTVCLRLFQGGGGMFVGSLVILTSAGIGLLWRQLVRKYRWPLTAGNLYLFGVLVQFDMLACMFLMPENVRYKILAAVAPPVLVIYPIGTLLLGLVLRRQRERRVAEKSLGESRLLLDRERGLLRSLLNAIPDVIFIKNTEGTYIDCNQAFAALMALPREEVIGKTDHDLFDSETAAKLKQEDRNILTSGTPLNQDKWVRFPNGQRLLLTVHKNLFRGLDGTLHGLAGIGRDITARKQTEEEREQLQAQLAQTQKIESVGHLAGGIAHDFNNMLAVILGQAELAELRLGDHNRLKLAISEIRGAARRSATLTQQLLAFARKQAISPQVVDLNNNVVSMFNMLRRVIGEDIQLTLNPGAGLWNVKIDPHQLDQILTNLCLNARDAIAGNGEICIKTENRSLDEADCSAHPQLTPGEYVVISVTDDGHGMDDVIRQQIFDPFFTTKGQGEGTGLGLATVHGIVTQNGGVIDVSSEPEQGSTFSLYFPKSEETPPPAADSSPAAFPRGNETILLVEDEKAVLRLAQEMLQDLGYRVLSAPSPEQALALVDSYKAPIHLLLSDVVMPEINGFKLSEQLRLRQPEMKVLFMSGYTANVISRRGILEDGVELIEKPFTREDLSQKIRKVLG